MAGGKKKMTFDVCLCERAEQGCLRGSADNGSANDVPFARVEPCSDAGLRMNIHRLCL